MWNASDDALLDIILGQQRKPVPKSADPYDPEGPQGWKKWKPAFFQDEAGRLLYLPLERPSQADMIKNKDMKVFEKPPAKVAYPTSPWGGPIFLSEGNTPYTQGPDGIYYFGKNTKQWLISDGKTRVFGTNMERCANERGLRRML